MGVRKRNLATWPRLRETNNSRALDRVRNKEKPEPTWDSGWQSSSEIEKWLEIQLHSWVTIRYPEIPFHGVLSVWLSYFLRCCYFSVWIFTPALTINYFSPLYPQWKYLRGTIELILLFIMDPLPLVRCFLFGSSQLWLGGRVS